MITGLPCASSGMNGIGGASITLAIVESSSGAASRGLEEAGDHLRRRRQDHHAADDLRDLVQAQLEAGGDAEVALAAADRPEEVRLGVLARLDDLAVGGDHLGREQVVDRQPVSCGPESRSRPQG